MYLLEVEEELIGVSLLISSDTAMSLEKLGDCVTI